MGKIAMLFAGQGSQYPGMGAEWYQNSQASKAVFDQLEQWHPGLQALCFHGTKEQLAQTQNTQPCLFAVDYAIACAVQTRGINADMLAGFSLGEIPALAFGGQLSLADAFSLVRYRAAVMQQASEHQPGCMYAILKLSAEQITALAESFPQVFPVNYNSPEQTVVAGKQEELTAFIQAVKNAGGRAVPLQVSGAFHSPYMNEAASKMAAYVQQFQFELGRYPVYANCTARPYEPDAAQQLVADQINHPVQWVNTINQMLEDGATCFIEVGPGKTLSGLVKKITPQSQIYHVETIADLDLLVEALQNTAHDGASF